MIFSSLLSIRSHPVRVRGLKRNFGGGNRHQIVSHPIRVRWLKRKLQYSVGGVCVGVALAVGDETTADGARAPSAVVSLCLPTV